MKYFFPIIFGFLFPSQLLGQSDNLCVTSSEFVVPLKKKSVFLSRAGKVILDSLLSMRTMYPNCRIEVMSFGNSNELEQQKAWDKTVSVVNYLLKNNIDSSSIIFQFAMEGEETDLVRITFTNWDGPYWTPAPIPCYSYHKLTKRRCRNPH